MTRKKAIAFFESIGALRRGRDIFKSQKPPHWHIYLRGKVISPKELQLMYFLWREVDSIYWPIHASTTIIWKALVA